MTDPNMTDPAKLGRVFDDLDERIARDDRGPGALRSWSTLHRNALALAATLAAVAVGAARLRVDAALYPRARFAITLVGLVVVAVALAIAGLRPLGAIGRKRDTALLFAGGALLLAAALVPIHHPVAAAWADGGAAFVPRSVACLLFGTAVAVPLVLLYWLLDRSELVAPGRAALGAMSAVIAGNAALFLHCPLSSASHLAAGHLSVAVVVGAGLGGLLGWRRRKGLAPTEQPE